MPPGGFRQPEVAEVKYVVLIYGNPESRQVWEGMTDAQRAAGLAYYQQLNDDLDASGERIVSERLAFPELAKRVGPLATDGGRRPGGAARRRAAMARRGPSGSPEGVADHRRVPAPHRAVAQ